jgi:hypothetical protein
MLDSTIFISEKRLVNRLRMYWDHIKTGDTIPLFAKFNQNYIADMWDNCLLFFVSHNGNKTKFYHCDYVGKNLSLAFGTDLKDRYVSSKDKLVLPGANLIPYLDKVLEVKDFVMSSGQFVNYRNKIVKYRDCIMPFCDSSGNITNLVVGISWREFE